MEFINKVEQFFIQLQYCLSIEPEPVFEGENGLYTLMLKPEIFFKLINDFNIDYPFIPENKIIELKGLMNKENINTKDALKIIENFKKQYWFLDTVTMFEPVTDKLKRTLQSINSEVTEKEINIELFNYQKYLQAKRESIYINLINEIQGIQPQQTETETEQDGIFNELAAKYKSKYGHELPFGAFLFNDMKTEVEKLETHSLRLNEYKKLLHYWVNISLTDSKVIGESEIEVRLIPLIKNEIILLESIISNPLKPTENKIEQQTPTFINNFDNIKPAEVYNHFKIGLVDKGYLKEQELNDYLKAAFELKTIPETLFKLKHTPTKQKIYTVFYIYYKDISQKKHERQKEYAALLGDFFEGYKTEIIQTNWARDYKIKR